MLVLYGTCALLVVLTPLYGSCRPWVIDCNPSLELLCCIAWCIATRVWSVHAPWRDSSGLRT